MAAPKITHRKLADLRPDPNNARTHGPDQVARIAGLMVAFGFTSPILADETGLIAAGHGRALGAEKVYAEGGSLAYPNGSPIPAGTVPVLDCTGWTPEQRRAYVLADNQVALEAGWDVEVLTAELDALATADFDLSIIGFDQSALDALALGDGGSTGAGRQSGGEQADATFSHVDQFAVIVRCANEAEQELRFNALRETYGAEDVKVVVV